jgi:hypothetical protein
MESARVKRAALDRPRLHAETLFLLLFPLRMSEKREPTSGLEPLSCSLRVSLFPTPNPAKNGCFAGTYDSALSVKYPPTSLNIASTADTTADNG